MAINKNLLKLQQDNLVVKSTHIIHSEQFKYDTCFIFLVSNRFHGSQNANPKINQIQLIQIIHIFNLIKSYRCGEPLNENINT